MCMLAAVPSLASAHTFQEPGSSIDAGSAVVLLLLLAAAALHGVGYARLRRNAGRMPDQWRRAACFATGLLALAICLLPPLDAWSQVSFSAHMVQHELLMLVAAPLLVLGRPLPIFLWAFPAPTRQRMAACVRIPATAAAWRWLVHPATGWIAHALALWVWHVPVLFRAALGSQGLHELQHFSFVTTALLFWSGLLFARAGPHRGLAVLYLFTTTVHTGVLGALITFAGQPLFAPGILAAPLPEVLRDQQLGGLIMWVPGSMVYVAAGLVMFLQWVRTAGGSPTSTAR
jgi:putative membrane protein